MDKLIIGDTEIECNVVSMDIEKPKSRYNIGEINQMKESSITVETDLTDDQCRQIELWVSIAILKYLFWVYTGCVISEVNIEYV